MRTLFAELRSSADLQDSERVLPNSCCLGCGCENTRGVLDDVIKQLKVWRKSNRSDWSTKVLTQTRLMIYQKQSNTSC